MQILSWIVRAFVFFALFAFALNNRQEATIHWFFGREWTAPMVFVVLGAFAIGCAFGVFAMVPSWWTQRRIARRSGRPGGVAQSALDTEASRPVQGEVALEHPPRDGL